MGGDFAHPENGNVVLIYYIETLQREPDAPGIYMYSYQTLNNSVQSVNQGVNAGLVVSDTVFKQYKVPKDN